MRPILEDIEFAQTEARIALSRLSELGSSIRKLKSRSSFNISTESIYQMADEVRRVEAVLADLHTRNRM